MFTTEPWLLDRKVPIALIATLALQSAGAIWWASGLDHRLATVEATQLVLATRTTSLEAASRADLSALRAEVQTRHERALDGQRGLSEQSVAQRADIKAIRAALERLERHGERSAGRSAGSLPPGR